MSASDRTLEPLAARSQHRRRGFLVPERAGAGAAFREEDPARDGVWVGGRT